MRPTKNELVLRRTTKFTKADINSVFTEINGNSDSIGGVIRKGQFGWLARGPLLEIFSLRNGNKISSYRFDVSTSFERCFITCCAEIDVPDSSYCLLAVGVQFGDDPGGLVAVYSVQESKVLRSIETAEKITCCHMINNLIVERTNLQRFGGCLAIGTDTGKIILLDLYLEKCEQTLLNARTSDNEFFLVPCHVVLSNMNIDHVRHHFRDSRQQNIGFGIQLDDVDSPSLILSLQSLNPLLSLAAGLEDGRLILYDLSDFQAFHIAYPPEDLSPLVKLCYIEPPDDPRACLYIWAFHENRHSSIAVMHSVMYDRKIVDGDEDQGFDVFEGFQSCSARLTLPTFDRGSIPVTCQSIMKPPSNDSEETISLSLLAWKSRKTSEVLIFDVNQWYKEQMPNYGDWRDNLSYLASFPLKESDLLDVWLDGRSIANFNSIQRPEEHFFPISLSFDCTVLRNNEYSKFHWPGLQNRALSMLSSAGSSALLEPSVYYHEVARASLIPQNTPDYSLSSTVSLAVQREAILSVALEHNCFSLLKECAKCWADGSHLGKKSDEGLSLSTLTDWIWRKAESIKDRCNLLCVPLFDHSGLRIDQRAQVELSYYSRQLKLLADLMGIILKHCRQYIPDEVKNTLTTQHNSMKMASEYQEVLQWMLNVGLLPEATSNSKSINSYLENPYEMRAPLIPYPYKALRSYYMSQRMKFKKINSGLLSPRTQSCRILYIDSFIEHECNANALREHWQESGGNGLYPPPSLQAMLRVLLVPDVAVESKYVLFVYFFLDLNMALEDQRYADAMHNFMKFPSVFKVSSSTMKIIQAFWNLDHGDFETALEDIISPFLHDQKLAQWQKELLIEALLVHHASKLALRSLQAPGPPISSLLELKTLLANDLVAEAFHLQRSRSDPELFHHFLTGCLYLGKLSALLDLALTEQEEQMLETFLRDTKSSKTENLHFVHLLQRSKYIEAIHELDELSRNKHSQHSVDYETPSLVLAAYNTTLTPATKLLSEVYYGIRNRLKAKDQNLQKLDTLSSQLLKHNANDLVGGVYHSSIISVDEATNYWDEELQKERNRLLYPANVAFVRRPQLDAFTGYRSENALCFPETFRGNQKRRLDGSDAVERLDPDETNENPKKRQRVNDSLSGTKTCQPLNISLLTRFKTRQGKKPSVVDNTLVSNIKQIRPEKDSSLTSLNTPIVKSSRQAVDSREESTSDASDFNRPDRIGTPHSILKVRTAESASVSSPARKPKELTPRRSISPKNIESSHDYVDEEKSIRFDLPSGYTTDTNSLQTSHESLEMSQRVPSTSIVSSVVEEKSYVENIKRYPGPSPRKTLHSTDISMISGDEEFFSPQESRDNSIAKKSIEASDSENEDVDEVHNVTQIERKVEQDIEPPKRWIPEGPKARKPLARSSRSRSKTPDLVTTPARKSSRLLERSQTHFMEIREVETTTESVRQTGSRTLSRLVLESNAKIVSALQPDDSDLNELEKGHIVAQSTEISQTRFISDGIDRSSDERKLSELSTVVGGSTLFMQPSGQVVYDSMETVLEYNESDDKIDLKLATTVEMTSSFNMPSDDESPQKNDHTMTVNRIEGRRSYKTDYPEKDAGIINSVPLVGDIVPPTIQNPSESLEVDEENNEHEIQNADELNEDSVGSNEEGEENGARNNDAEQQEEEARNNDAEQEEEEATSSSEETDDDEIGSEEQYESVVIEDDDSDDEETDDEEGSTETGTNSNDVISISSGNESTEQPNGDSLTTNEIQSSPALEIQVDEASSPGLQENVEKLLYSDLDIETPTFSGESVNPTNIEPPFPNLPSISQIDENLSTEAVQLPMETSVSVSLSSTSVTYTDSGIDNVPPSGMTLNVLTGEFERIDEEEEEEMEKHFTLSDIIKRRLEAKSPKMMNVRSVAEALTYNLVTCTSKMTEKPSSSSESSTKADEIDETDDSEKLKDIENQEIKTETINLEEQDTLRKSPSSHNVPETAEKSRQIDPTPSTSGQSVYRSRSKSTDKSTDDIRIRVSDDDDDGSGDDDDDDKKAGHENSRENENITKTPVKIAIENDPAEDSDRILRSARRLSTSSSTTDATKPETDSFLESTTPVPRRASSVPRADSVETPTRSILRRRANSTDNPSTPTRILTRRRSILLDRIEEDSVLDSPRRSARKRLPTEPAESEVTPRTPTMKKRTRKASTSSVDTPELSATPRRAAGRKGILSEDNTLTPQRITRRSSVSGLDTPSKATPIAEARGKVVKTRGRKTSTPEEENIAQQETESEGSEELEGSPEDLVKVKFKSVRQRKKFSVKNEDEQHSENSEVDSAVESPKASYESSRRLTRNQQSVMEKSAEIASKKVDAVPKKIIRRRASKKDDESSSKRDDVSETESVISTRSKNSATSETRRVTRSSSLKMDDDDAVSVASTKSTRSTKATKKAKSAGSSRDKSLDAIVEEDQENAKKADSNDDTDDDSDSMHSTASKRTATKKGRGKKAPQK